MGTGVSVPPSDFEQYYSRIFLFTSETRVSLKREENKVPVLFLLLMRSGVRVQLGGNNAEAKRTTFLSPLSLKGL